MTKKEIEVEIKEMRRDLATLGIRGRRADSFIARHIEATKQADKELIGLEQEVARFFRKATKA